MLKTIKSADSKFDIELRGIDPDYYREPAIYCVLKRGRRPFPLGEATIGDSITDRHLVVDIKALRIILFRDLDLRDAKMAGYKTMHEATRRLSAVYPNMHVLDEWTQVLFSVKGVN